MKSLVDFGKTPLAIALGVALVLAVATWLFLGLAKDHQSAMDICTSHGGSYNALTKDCAMPAGAAVKQP